MPLSDASRVPGGSFLLLFLFSFLTTLSCSNKAEHPVFALLDHARRRLHMSNSFSAGCLNGNRWNATVSHSKVSFRPFPSPLPYQPPHFLTPKTKRSNFLSFVLLYPTWIMKSEARRKSPVLLGAWRSWLRLFCAVCLLWRSGVLGGMWKRCGEEGAAGGGFPTGHGSGSWLLPQTSKRLLVTWRPDAGPTSGVSCISHTNTSEWRPVCATRLVF